jgi:hypothetical protein
MKKQIITSLFASLLFISYQSAYATAIIGSTFPQQIVDMVEQFKIEYSQDITAISTAYTKYAKDVLDPLANVLIAQAQKQAATDLINWANGGFNGTPSFITDPGKFVKNRGLEAVKGATISVNLSDPYANSILNGVVKSFRSNESTEQQLANLAVSQVPALLQDNVCKDETLTKLATDQVRNRDGTTNYSAMITQKTYLYQRLCAGNPIRDKQLANTLMAMGQANPSLTGLDGILLVSSGENQYTKTTRGIIATQEAAAKANKQAEVDLSQGGGLSSQRKCKTEATNDETGEKYCKEWELTTPSGLVRDATAKAQGAGLDRLGNVQGAGVLSNFLTGFATIIITQAIKGSVQGSNGGDVILTAPGASGQQPVVTTIPSQNNTSVTTQVSTTYSQDLVNEPKSRDSLLKPILKEMTEYEKILNQLDALDTMFLADFTPYRNEVNAIENLCNAYSTSTTGNGSVAGGGSLIEASTTIANRKGLIAKKLQELNKEQSDIQAALILIATTTQAVNRSYSSEQISNIYNVYQNEKESKEYPAFNAFADRKGDYEQTKLNAKSDLGTDPEGPLTKARNACTPVSTSERF